jgi:hypothetical protein
MKKQSAHLVLGIGRKILAIEVRGQHDASRCIWVFGRDDVREVPWAIWCPLYEAVLLYVPFEIAESGSDVVADKSVVFGVGYLTHEIQIQATEKKYTHAV